MSKKLSIDIISLLGTEGVQTFGKIIFCESENTFVETQIIWYPVQPGIPLNRCFFSERRNEYKEIRKKT